MKQKSYKANMFSKNIRSELILRTLESMIKKRVLRVEVSRASSKSEKPPEPIAIFGKDYQSRIEPAKPIYTQGYPSMRSVNPYERDPYQYYQTQQTCQGFQNKSEVPQNAIAFPHNAEAFPHNAAGFPENTTASPYNAEAFPHNTAGFPQNGTEFPQYAAGNGKYDCIGPCCLGVGGGGRDSKAPLCSGGHPYIKPTVSGVQSPCSPPQPCPCCQQYPCSGKRCGPCGQQGNWCIPQLDCCGRRIVPPPECRPGPVPPNPCCPQYPKKGVFKLYRSIFFFICIPVIILQFINAMSHEPCPKIPCRDYEYMRIRSKRFPWGEGVESFFHNEEVNHLPGDCEQPDLDCEP